MFRRTVLTVGLLGACVWCLVLVVRANSAEGSARRVWVQEVSLEQSDTAARMPSR